MKHTYFPKVTDKQIKAVKLAKVRGDASVEWHKNNVLTADNLAEFKRYIKNAEMKYKLKPKP
jgi:hypothetical protein